MKLFAWKQMWSGNWIIIIQLLSYKMQTRPLATTLASIIFISFGISRKWFKNLQLQLTLDVQCPAMITPVFQTNVKKETNGMRSPWNAKKVKEKLTKSWEMVGHHKSKIFNPTWIHLYFGGLDNDSKLFLDHNGTFFLFLKTSLTAFVFNIIPY